MVRQRRAGHPRSRTHPAHQGMLGSAIGIGSMIVDGDEDEPEEVEPDPDMI